MRKVQGHTIRAVGAFEAKTHLSSLLQRVARGEVIQITRRGKVVGRLVPTSGSFNRDRKNAVAELLQFAKGKRLGKLTIRQLIERGRRF